MDTTGSDALPALVDCATLLQILRRYPLLERGQLAQVDKKVKPPYPDVKKVARALIERRWLTTYQMDQLLQGRAADLVLGNYLILEQLGEGGMGQVFKAKHRAMNRIVAVKVIRKERLDSNDSIKRFRREIEAAAKLSHPNVVVAHDAGQVGDVHFFAMEYVEGTDLGKLIKGGGRLPVHSACDYIRQAALGLQHACERGMVHRDIKPSNLLLTTDGVHTASESTATITMSGNAVVKILDMGLARLSQLPEAETATAGLTQEGAIMGTPDYISPEQADETHSVDIRSDLYSLGCTFYHLLTGQVPFPGGKTLDKLFRHRFEEPQPLEQFRSDVPPEVAAVVRKLMAKNPRDRFQTPAELAMVLKRYVRQEPMLLEVPAAGAATTFAVTPGALSDSDSPFSFPVDPLSASTSRVTKRSSTNLPTAATKPNKTLWIGVIGGAVTLALALTIILVIVFSGSKSTKTNVVALDTSKTKESPPTSVSSPTAKKESSATGKKDPSATPPIIPPTVHVSAQKPWQDTMIEVQPGSNITVKAGGIWNKGNAASGPEGLPAPAPVDRNIVLASPSMCLIGRVGDGQPFAVAAGQALNPPQKGRLFLQANDFDLAGNSGDMLVEIEGGVKQNAAATAPHPCRVEQAEAEAKALDGLPKDDKLWPAIIAFRSKYPDLPQAQRVTQLFLVAPSPLDKLSAANIPSEQRLQDAQPKELVAVLGEHRWVHGAEVLSMAISGDGKMIASGARDGSVRVWNTASGQSRSFRGHKTPVYALAFTHNLKGDKRSWHLASGGESELRVWDLAANKDTSIQMPITGVISTLTFSPDDRVLAFGFSNPNNTPTSFQLWDWARKKELFVSPKDKHAGTIRDLAFSPDGKTLVSMYNLGNADQILLWSLTYNGTALGPVTYAGALAPKVPGVTSFFFSPDGRSLASVNTLSGLVVVWDVVAGGKERFTVNHAGARRALFAGDGKHLITAGDDNFLRIWSLAGEERGAFSCPGSVRWLRSVGDPKKPAEQTVLAAGAGPGGSIYVWEMSPPEKLRRLESNNAALSAISVSPDAVRIAAGAENGTVSIWEQAENNFRPLGSHTREIVGLAFAPDGKLYSAGADGAVKIWADGKEQGELTPSGKAMKFFALSGNGKLAAAVGETDAIKLWDVSERKERLAIKTRLGQITALAVSPDGTKIAAAGGAKNEVTIWNAADGKQEWTDPNRGTSCSGLAFSSDGRYLAVLAYNGTQSSWQVYSVKDKSLLGNTGALEGRWTSVVFAPDDKSVVILTGGNLVRWSVAEKAKVWESRAFGPAFAFAPDGRHIVTANDNGTVYILRLRESGAK
jgi:serine/threonine-protein kinase